MSFAFKMRMQYEKWINLITGNTEDYAKVFGKTLAWVIGALLIFFVFYAVRFNGLTDIDAQDYAQIARHLSRGEGFTTSLIRPQSLCAAPTVKHHPELTAPPLYIFIESGMFTLFGATDKVACLTSALFYLLSIPLFLFIANKLFDRSAAFLSLALYITSAPLLDVSISGLQMPFLVFLFMLLTLAVYALDGRSIIKTLAAGILVGLCYLTQHAYILLIFPLCLHLFFICETPRQKIRHIVYAALACVVTVFPWACRNLALTGTPFFTYDFLKPVIFSDAFPGNSIFRVAREMDFPTLAILKLLVKKLYFGLRGLYQQVLFLPQNYLMPFFIVSLFSLLQNAQTLVLRRYVVTCGILICAVMAAYYPGTNILIPFIPFIIMASCDFFNTTLNNSYLAAPDNTPVPEGRRFVSNKTRIAAVAIFVAVNVYPLVTRIVLGGSAQSPYPKDRMEMVQKLVEKDEVVVTDIPWALAWYCDRTAIWLPLTEIDYVVVKGTAGKINNIYLSPVLFEYPRAEMVDMWKNIYLSRQVPKELFLEKGTYLKAGGMFLSNEPKWEKYQEPEKKDDGIVPNPVSAVQ